MFKFSRKYSRAISILLLLLMVQSFLPTSVMALTSGPAQPETQQFAPAGMDNMVDPFTGDFSYNIPLMDVGGYPININYSAGITPDAEASWVGLGWNLNVGAITRNMRGLPDDFAGDNVTKEYNVKPNQTFGVTGKMKTEIFGFEKKLKNVKIANKGLSVNATIQYNTYNGFGIKIGASPSVQGGSTSRPKLGGNLGVNASIGSDDGFEVTPTMGLSSTETEGDVETGLSASISFPMSTREGLKGMTLSASRTKGTTSSETATEAAAALGMADVSSEGGVSSSAFKGFATPTFSPSMEHSKYSVNANLKFDFSKTRLVSDGKPFGFVGFYSGEFLKETSKDVPAFGYMYSGLSQSPDILMDFNREKDGSFNQFTTNLPLTNYTYDVFSVSGQGIGGAYRMYRGDVGSVRDPVSTSTASTPGIGVEVGLGATLVPSATTVKVGIDGNYSQTNTYSGPWQSGGNGINSFNNEKETALNVINKEMVYFKKVGEMAAETDNTFVDNVQVGTNALRHGMVSSTSFLGDGELNSQYVDYKYNSSSISTGAANQRNVRKVRSTPFTTLLADEATYANILPIYDHTINSFTWNAKTGNYRNPDASDANIGYAKSTISRIDADKKAHHISEIRVTDNAGARYIYGIPAYNTHQEEVTFAIANGNSSNTMTGMVQYSPNNDDTPGNSKGLDHYYNKVITPAYAHSYLLTTVLSADYVDRDYIPGPSDGDLGNYTKFNYSRAIAKYKWRTPYSAAGSEGSYTQGMVGDDAEDDKANYVYGEKEIWYLHSIETRTHVAEFYLKDREDGLGAINKDGGKDITGPRQQYIDKIVLYSKPDKLNSSAIPVKVVHFEYDYSLCPNVPNNSGNPVMVNGNDINAAHGKLTLKKVWFTYGSSEKGILNPYVFNYADQTFNGSTDAELNPAYGIKNYDRWGNFKKDGTTVETSNAEFPYTNPDKATTDKYAAVYALSSIETPTGGTIRAYYESDDYGYVQDKRAMRMFKLAGFSNNGTNEANDINNNTLYAPDTHKEWVIVDLAEGFTPESNNPNDEFNRKYLSGINQLYFKVFAKVLTDGDRYEFVSGYGEVDPSGTQLIGSAPYYKAKIKLVRVKAGGAISSEVNPITKAGWMFARMNLSREVTGAGNAEDNGLEQVLRSILSMFESIGEIFTGFSGKMLIDGNCNTVELARSFVRLNEPDKIKMGGGHRVKAIVMVDNWGLMKSDKEALPNQKQTSFYGQKYNYSMLENGETISAGVAAYEPILGNDENPFRLPVTQIVAPHKSFYLETPFGESFFPSPTVGYREVTVTPIKVTAANYNVNSLPSNGTGYVKHEFYTAKDFPTIVHYTNLETKRHSPSIIFKFMKFDSKDLVTCSQGYSVELNDMHGKQKAQRVYPDMAAGVSGVTPSAISEVEYTYKTNTDGTLSNKATYIKPDLTIVREGTGNEMGVEIDLVQDQRYSESQTIGGGLAVNGKLSLTIIPPAPAPIPSYVLTAFPDVTIEGTRFRSIVDTKVINRTAILETTTAKENGASITTKNIAWDAKTGQVLLTQTENEFHDPIYNFTYPGYWAYQRMHQAAETEGFTFNNFASVQSQLKDGDELCLSGMPGIYHVNENGGVKSILDKNGNPVTSGNAKVVRSGARNNSTTPVGSVTTLVNPIKAGNTSLVFDEVLNTGVNEYKEGWQRFCNCDLVDNTQNPYVLGLKGNLRPFRNWTYLTNRKQSIKNENVSVRKDGVFLDFSPFWIPSGNVLIQDQSNPMAKWQFISRIEKYNAIGMPLEEKDALGRYSAALYSYAKNLQVATSNNSKYQETGFDGFEDYDFGDCADDHMSWREHSTNVTIYEAHTGRKSIKVLPGLPLKISKVIVECQ